MVIKFKSLKKIPGYEYMYVINFESCVKQEYTWQIYKEHFMELHSFRIH